MIARASSSQPKEWEKLQAVHGGQTAAAQKVVNRLDFRAEA